MNMIIRVFPALIGAYERSGQAGQNMDMMVGWPLGCSLCAQLSAALDTLPVPLTVHGAGRAETVATGTSGRSGPARPSHRLILSCCVLL